MTITDRFFFLVILIVLLATPLQGAASTPQVVVSIKPVHSIMAGLMEGVETPALLVEGTASPFDYRPSVQQLKLLASTNLFIWIGTEIEPMLADTVKNLGNDTRVIELLSLPALKILPSRWIEGQRDPFFWLDSRNAIILADELARLLAEIDPENTHIYLRNRKKMHARLTRLDRDLEYGYRGLVGAPAVVYYDTLQYFQQAYAFKVAETLSGLPGQQPDTRRLLRAKNLIAEGLAGCVLTEAGYPSPHLSLMKDEKPVKVLQIESLGAGFSPGPQLYTELMEYNNRVMSDCAGRPNKTRTDNSRKEESDLPIEIRGRFMLIDQHGGLVSDQDLLGKYQLLYFGYTFCPDVCPMSLAVISQVMDGLGEQAALFQPYFITVDPERDTVAVMRNYVRYFGDRLIGLTGSKAMIERVANQYRVKYEKVLEKDRPPELYLMDHSPSVFLIAPDGTFVTKFAYGIDAGQMLAKLRAYVPELQSN